LISLSGPNNMDQFKNIKIPEGTLTMDYGDSEKYKIKYKYLSK